MTDYITVTWVSETPTARGMSWGNVCFLTNGTRPNGCSNPQLVSSSNYAGYITNTNSLEYIALGSYFKNFSGTPTNSTYVYWMGSGSGITGILSGSGASWTLSNGPFSAINHVQVDPTGGSSWQEISGYTSGTCPSGYKAGTGYSSIYNGEITFGAEYVGDGEVGGPYFSSGGTTYSGSHAQAIIHASGGILRALATQNGFGLASQQLKSYDIQFICPLYNVAGDGTGLLSTSACNDLKNALTMVAGKRQMVVWALPKTAAPNTTYSATAYDYNQFRNYIGQDKNAVVIYADVTTGTNLTGSDDPSAALLGKIVSTHPHETLTLKTINIGLASRASEADRSAWDAGKIICVFQKTDYGYDSDQLNFGFTFASTSPSDRISNVRCKYITEYNVLADLWALLSSGTVRVSKAGLNSIIATINGTLDRLLSQGIIDPGERVVDIPLLRGSATEWSWANANRKVPAIIVRWPYRNNVEQLTITQFGEII